jgi:hypothetical protein
MMRSSVLEMSEQSYGADRGLIVELVAKWAHAHPLRDEPLFFTLEGDGISPKALAAQVAENTRLGAEHLAALAHMAELQRVSLVEVLSRMLRSVEEHSHQAAY